MMYLFNKCSPSSHRSLAQPHRWHDDRRFPSRVTTLEVNRATSSAHPYSLCRDAFTWRLSCFRITITSNGIPLTRLNELELVEGYLYANVFLKKRCVLWERVFLWYCFVKAIITESDMRSPSNLILDSRFSGSFKTRGAHAKACLLSLSYFIWFRTTSFIEARRSPISRRNRGLE